MWSLHVARALLPVPLSTCVCGVVLGSRLWSLVALAGVILLRALVSTVLRRARHDISLVSLVSLERARLSRTRVSLRLDDHMRARCGRVCVAVGETSRRFAILRGRAIGSL